MKVAGIIAEFNPFHNGHRFLVDEVKKAGYSHIVAVMSSYCVQRGDIAIFDPTKRAKVAVQSGVDLVLELAPQYALAPAKDFAKAGVGILSRLGCVDAIAFGSETGEVEPIKKASEAVENLDKSRLKELISSGLTYPQAVSTLLPEHQEVLGGANNTLGVEYLIASSGKLDAFTVKRTNKHDGENTENGYASASKIRKMLENKEDASAFMPSCEGEICTLKSAEKAVLYRLCGMSLDDFKALPYGLGGISQRLYKACRSADSLEEIFESVKAKNLTFASVRRAVLCSALGITAGDIFAPPFARVLALNEKGAEILKASDAEAMPCLSSLARLEKISANAKRTAQIIEASARLQWLAGEGEYASPYTQKVVAIK